MLPIIASIILIALSALGIIVRKTVFSIALPEQKRRAQHGNERTKALYRLAAYGDSARVFFWAWISITAASGMVIIARTINPWLSLVIIAALIWFSFAWLPKGSGSTLGLRITLLLAPSISALLNFLYKPLHASSKVVAKRFGQQRHTGIYERSDLEEFLERIEHEDESRIAEEELQIIRRALAFQNQTVADCMIPASKLMVVKSDDTVGPVLINEIHASGQPYVLVKETKKGPVLGLLAFEGLDLHSTGAVTQYMSSDVQYLHEKDNLSQALHAFKETNHTVFLVVDNEATITGLLTLHALLTALLGHVPGDGFDEYSNPEIVSRRHDPVPENKKPDIDYEEVLE